MLKIHNLKDAVWVELYKTDATEISNAIQKYKLPRNVKGYMLDKHEHSRFEYDDFKDYSILIMRALRSKKIDKVKTSPAVIVIKDNLIVTKNSKSFNKLSDEGECNKFDLIFDFLVEISNPYFAKIDNINAQAEKLQSKNRSINNKKLQEVSNLKSDLVYLKSATAANLLAIHQFENAGVNPSIPIDFTSQEKQKIEDVTVEYNECKYMFDVLNDIVGQIEETYGNIINSNLNQTMKVLTIWSLVLAIPPIISGFYGMNVGLPFANSWFSWIFTIIITIVIIVVMLMYLRKHHDL
ncbi:magnesium transporter CorA family protein [Apilactobacillus sp. TMW 2.2459]|jgi:magnesium transporter|uniref:Magnesium transporter CorA family protein n=1 Tax=Apilactobacillus xinyiensis TaxID=2841032 RepID=A0ABT0I108_9LACO|nr:magnesium transporter CorA family protein [Apilactobacillus xinyiensis]MCK8623934.1 magnesium transporter CorA family protein [Apilactobacillus xinyiensis]MCL0311527.1 magnesium transporter CorA family protein [Apilactobacillus xinyiensis]MCL0330094.1 magnesium transporter CorA family protein [Apilactobacillus xinyiensis]